jgi:hypothetical protein
MPLASIRFVGGRRPQLLGRVLPQQLVQLEATEVRTPQKRLGNKLGKQAQVGAGNRGGCSAIEAAAEHGQP